MPRRIEADMSKKADDGRPADLKPDTKACDAAAASPTAYHGFVNPPVFHASTVLYPNAADMVAHRARYQYGRRGTPTSEALENALPGSRDRVAPACRCCRRARRQFPPRCSRSSAPAIIFWLPTASIGRRAYFATRILKRLGDRDDLLRSADRRRDRAACCSRIRAPCSSKRRARNRSRCRTSRPSPPSRMTRAHSS